MKVINMYGVLPDTKEKYKVKTSTKWDRFFNSYFVFVSVYVEAPMIQWRHAKSFCKAYTKETFVESLKAAFIEAERYYEIQLLEGNLKVAS